MHICFIAEGCYPYIVGGVSSWIQTLITSFPEYEFSIIAINPKKELRGKFKYEIPENVKEIQEVFLDEMLEKKGKWNKRIQLSKDEKDTFVKLLNGMKIDWKILFELFGRHNKKKKFNSVDLLLSKPFYEIIQDSYGDKYTHVPFTDVFWTLRSMYIILFSLLEEEYLEADLYHTVATGYAGVVGSLINYQKKKPLVLTEHGIYTREREEELIKSDWVQGYFKDMWIKYFKSLSDSVYEGADKVVSLFGKNRDTQIELGCNKEKIQIIHNGVKIENFENLVRVNKESGDKVLIAGIVRVVPIKDIMTMLQAFAIVESKRSNVEFLIIGPTDEDEEYYEECLSYMEFLGLKNVTFTGRVNIKDYMDKIDIHVLTSISEGQPLSIMEAMICKIPNITTNVGDCSSLINGVDDSHGTAGAVVNIMDFNGLADNIIDLVDNKELREKYGLNGYNRVINRYSYNDFIQKYKKLYREYE